MKLSIQLLALLFTLFIMYTAQASERHHKETTTNITNNYTDYNYTTPNQALFAGLSAIDCDYTTRRWQGGIGLGFHDGVGAPVAGLCKKFEDTLMKVTVGRQDGITAGNIGFMFSFK